MSGARALGMTRRAFLESVALLVVGCSEGGSRSAADAPPGAAVKPVPQFAELGAMRIVGLAYLELRPGTTVSGVVAELGLDRGWAAVEQEIRNQYAAGDVVSVEGWVLALTEARLYAAVAIGAIVIGGTP